LQEPNKTFPSASYGQCSFAYSALACFRMGMSGSASFQKAKGFVAGEPVSAAQLAYFRVGTSGLKSLQMAEKSPLCLQRARESPDRGGIFPACFCPASEEECHPVPSLPRIPRNRNCEAPSLPPAPAVVGAESSTLSANCCDGRGAPYASMKWMRRIPSGPVHSD